MLTSYILGTENKLTQQVSGDLISHCPKFKTQILQPEFTEKFQAELEETPVLLFTILDEFPSLIDQKLRQLIPHPMLSIICIGTRKEHAYQAIQLSAFKFLLASYPSQELIETVHAVEQKIQSQFSPKPVINEAAQLIGIPTKQGYKFISIQDIIKCKRERNYTRISLQQEGTIISDANIGDLMSKLSTYGFYAPHKSYIINLQQICKYSKEGFIILKDGSTIPLSKRLKNDFFKNILVL